MRRALLRALAGMVYGGLPPRRPDQVDIPSSAGVAPGTASGVFKGRQVIIFGTGGSSGLFVYSGAPARGNPPQVAIVASGVTADPFGNAIGLSKILIQANVITESAGIFRTSPSAPLIQLDGPHDALLIYDAAANLVDTITPVATNDGLGHTVYAGIVNYNAALTQIVQLLAGALNVGTPAQIAGTGGAAPGIFQLDQVSGAGGVVITGGQKTAADVPAQMFLESQANTGANQPIINLDSVVFMPTGLGVPTAVGVAALLRATLSGMIEQTRPSGDVAHMSTGGQTKLATVNVTGGAGGLGDFTIGAGDAETGSVYEAWYEGAGNMGITVAPTQWGCRFNGVVQGIQRGFAAAAVAASQAWRWMAVVRLTVRSAGAGGVAVITGTWWGEQTTNDNVPGTAADWGMSCSFGVSATFAFNTTVANTFGLQVATGGTISVDCISAHMRRVV